MRALRRRERLQTRLVDVIANLEWRALRIAPSRAKSIPRSSPTRAHVAVPQRQRDASALLPGVSTPNFPTPPRNRRRHTQGPPPLDVLYAPDATTCPPSRRRSFHVYRC